MNRKLLPITLITLLVLLLSAGGAAGQGPGPEEGTEPLAADAQPQGAASIAATVNSRISYQGLLQEGSNLVNDSRDMIFRFYADDACATQVGSDIVKSGVTVTDGLFSVELDVSQDDFNGQRLWLQVQVGSTAIGCREIIPAPYALSLRPGAEIIGDESGSAPLVVQNYSSDDYSTGLSAYNFADSGRTYGVYGESASTSGRGVYGYALATSGITYGVYGRTASPDGVGVYGIASGTGGTNYAIYGMASSSSNYAGFFYGNVHVAGSLSKGGGSFKIDHPLDPENKYLSHSFVESPDMMNVYNGNVTLDANGEAWVALPDYFEALNRDFRYQLTPIGSPGPNLYIAEEISGGRFKIAGGQPGSKVSWHVTGIRQDPWANAHRIPVEEEKSADEQGYYLYPELYGQPESKGIEWLCGFGRRE